MGSSHERSFSVPSCAGRLFSTGHAGLELDLPDLCLGPRVHCVAALDSRRAFCWVDGYMRCGGMRNQAADRGPESSLRIVAWPSRR